MQRYHRRIATSLLVAMLVLTPVSGTEKSFANNSSSQTYSKNTESSFVSRGVPRTAKNSGALKTYMDYRSITSKGSPQYKFQKNCRTDKNGLRRYGKYYVVAMANYYSDYKIGGKFRIKLKDGKEEKYVYVIIGDIKQDKHTYKLNKKHRPDGNIVEFIVDRRKLQKLAKKMGDVSYASSELKGKIIRIEEIVEE